MDKYTWNEHQNNQDLGVSDAMEVGDIDSDFVYGIWNIHTATMPQEPTPTLGQDIGIGSYGLMIISGKSMGNPPKRTPYCEFDSLCEAEIRRIVREELATPTPTVTPTPTITPNLAKGKMIRVYPFCSVEGGWESHTMEGRGEIVDGVYLSTWGEFHMAGPGKGCQEMVYATFTPINGPTPIYRSILDIDYDGELTFIDTLNGSYTIKDYYIDDPTPTEDTCMEERSYE